MKKIKLFGFCFSAFDCIEEAVTEIFKTPDKCSLPIVMTPNVEQIVNLDRSLSLKRFLSGSYMILADGMPVVWVGKLLNKRLNTRMAGSDIFPLFWEEAKLRKKKVFFVTSSNKVGEMLQSEYSEVSYYTPSYFDLNSSGYVNELNNISRKLSEFKPDFVVIGISYPKREVMCKDLIEMKESFSNSTYLLLGAAPEFYLRIKKRAPMWMQIIGFEWFYRLLLEPKRLFKRYLISGIRFIPIVVKEMSRAK